jgi:hypothetical protein
VGEEVEVGGGEEEGEGEVDEGGVGWMTGGEVSIGAGAGDGDGKGGVRTWRKTCCRGE